MTEPTRRVSCLCSRVQVEVTLPSKWCAHCHCTMCRRAHGAALVTWFGMERDRVRIVTGQADLQRYQSSPEAWRSFCGRCGSTLLFEGDRWPDEIHLVVAGLDGPLDRAPSSHCYWDRHVEWLEVSDDLPRLGGDNGTTPLGDGSN